MRHIDHESTIGVGPTLTEPRLLVPLSENKALAAAARFAFAVHAPGLNANARERSDFDGCIFQSLLDGYTLGDENGREGMRRKHMVLSFQCAGTRCLTG